MQYTIRREPRGEEYRGLLELAAAWCPKVLLVVRPRLGLSERASALSAALAPFVIRQQESEESPGTRLLAGRATVTVMRLNADSLRLISVAAEGLYDWR